MSKFARVGTTSLALCASLSACSGEELPVSPDASALRSSSRGAAGTAQNVNNDCVWAYNPDSLPGPLGVSDAPLSYETCDGAECCPATAVPGNPSNPLSIGQSLTGTSADDCLVGSNASENANGQTGDDVLVMGGRNDRGYGRGGNDVLFGQDGHDRLSGGPDHDRLFGGFGDDQLFGDAGNDVLIPGPGTDTAYGRGGNDTLVIRDLCEVEHGETLDGGSGVDTLVAPVSSATLATLGVTVQSVEITREDPGLSGLSPCGGCGCELSAGSIECCSGHGTCSKDIDVNRTICECDPGYFGDDCSLACAGGNHESCELQVYKNGDGTTGGLAVSGRAFFADTGAESALDGFRSFIANHESLMQIEPVGPAAEVNTFEYQDTDLHGSLAVHRYTQRYRGLPIHGPHGELKLTAAEGRGVISFTGNFVSDRPDYRGALDDLVCQGAAENAMLMHWQAEFPESSPTITGTELVAVPHLRLLAYRSTISGGGEHPSGSILVSAAQESAGTLLGLFDDRNMLEQEVEVQLLADNWTLWPNGGSVNTDPVVYSTHRTGDENVEVEAATVDDSACGGTSPCYMLQDGDLYIYDRFGQMGTDNNMTGAYGLPVSTSTVFGGLPGTFGYNNQNAYHKMRSAMYVLEDLMACRWDWGPNYTSSPCTAPNVLTVTNMAAPGFGGRFRGPDTIQPLLLPGNTLAAPWTTRFFDPQWAGGQLVAPSRIEINAGNSTSTYYHELGHHLDWFSSHGAGGFVENMLSLYMAAPGCATPTTGCCRANTSDEAAPLAETIAEFTDLFLGRRLHSELPLGAVLLLAPGSSFAIASHSVSGSGPLTFTGSRPSSQAQLNNFPPNSNSGCDNGSGYLQVAAAQAFWEFLNGENCGAGQGIPSSCTALGIPVGPDGVEVGYDVLTGRAFQYALSKQPPSGGSYQMLFDDMGEYIECLYRVGADTQEPFNSFASIFAHHGINVFAPSPRFCPQICGDGLAQMGEACDGSDLSGQSCEDLGYSGGTLGCNAGCQFDETDCNICGDGAVQGGEDCDGDELNGETCESVGDGSEPWGALGCNADCTFDLSLCSSCEPGTVDCRCLDDNVPSESNPDLPDGGIFGDGRYCLEDVALGGDVRCVDPVGSEPARCVACNTGQGVWCPCTPDEGCSQPETGAYEGPAGGSNSDTLVCEAACDPNFLDDCGGAPALGHGYCFVQGEPDPIEGGAPSWFFEQYCTNVAPGLSCVQELGEARVCQMDGGPMCWPQ